MEPQFKPENWEQKLYEFWERKNHLQVPKKGKPYTILMPPPNANASLHAGHGMYTIDDIMIRYKRLQGYASLWIPGVDHAGFETQFVYEKQLAKQDKSRMDYDRDTLYKNIFQFVQDNSGFIYTQFKKLGFLADWNRSIFTLDQKVQDRVFATFKKMHDEGLIYRDEYIVNYCTYCGTTLAELEMEHVERKDPLYYVRYPLAEEQKRYIVVATVRPEPIFADTHLAVNPKDKKNQKYIGQKAHNPLTNHLMEIIVDEYVDPAFGTGIVKLTPAHDPHDFVVAKKKGLPIIEAIDWRGKIKENGGKYSGMKVKKAREEVVNDLRQKNLIEKIDEDYFHSVAVCYKCKHDLESLVMPNWFVKVESLKKLAVAAVKKNQVVFHPAKYKKQILDWLSIMHDWPISRQIVWGIRIPIWYKVDSTAGNIFVWWLDKTNILRQGAVQQFLEKGVSLSEIENGLQKVSVLTGLSSPTYIISQTKPQDGAMYLPETDTFDTWFSSGQWPLVTLKENEYKDRFPTDMMGTLSDILRFWVSRMLMFSLYLRKDVPFKHVYLWSMVADAKGIKMSKSRGNVINPLEMVVKYGADAFRASLVFGIGEGGTVILAEDKIRGMRNFTNKIWNMGRFIYLNPKSKIQNDLQQLKILKSLKKEFVTIKKQYFSFMEKYQFSRAFGLLYEFLWHRFADYYIERLKDEMKSGKIEMINVLKETYFQTLALLHPFMPFVTEAVFQIFHGEKASILDHNFFPQSGIPLRGKLFTFHF